MSEYHEPVLLKRCIEALKIKKNGIYCDATLGGGGHSEEILKADDSIKLFSFDQDDQAIEEASKRLKKYGDRVSIIKSNFERFRTALSLEKVKRIDGILYDLGVSTHQIDCADRGFSFSQDGKLDMRMNSKTKISAYDVVNSYSIKDLSNMFRNYGEEKKAFKIAKEINYVRQKKTIETTLELADIISKVARRDQALKSKARIFQAIRIHVNGELDVLKESLKHAVNLLNPGGRLVVISYHSLEDRIIKHFFKDENKSCICPSDFPECRCNKESRLKIITKKPLIPTEEEIRKNNRARSAKLRIAERR